MWLVYRKENEAADKYDPKNQRADTAGVIRDYLLGAGGIAVDQQRSHVYAKTRHKAYRVHVGQDLLGAAGNDDDRRKENRVDDVNPVE